MEAGTLGAARSTLGRGLRLALGARTGEILRLVIGRGFRMTMVGLLLGGLAAVALGRTLTGLLYGVGPTDPLTYAGVAVLLTTVALLASWLPARRAARVDPTISLRCE